MKEASKLDRAEEILKLPISYEERGKKIGKEIGERLGREEERRKIALNMLRESVELELVMKFTKLSREEVEQLKKEI